MIGTTKNIKVSFPHLVTYAANLNITFPQACPQQYLLNLFELPLPTSAHEEFLQFEHIIHWNLRPMDRIYTWGYPWAQKFSVAKAYSHFMNSVRPPLVFK
jgi:hypothetical protein